jgi:FdhD protein
MPSGRSGQPAERGVECRMTLKSDAGDRLAARRRHLAGPMGCGLCGLESLDAATRALPRVGSALTISAEALLGAMDEMSRRQHLNRETRGIHAAGFFEPGAAESVIVREDVGRHNALDKIVGSLARDGRGGARGAVLLTSRVSIELVQKTAMLGAPILIAVSVPTAHAVRLAKEAGITLAAIARDDGFEVFTHPDRISFGAESHVA